MTAAPVLTFFNNKGGVGKTSLVYHLAWMLAEEGRRVLACDLDPQANLTASFLTEDELESLWSEDDGDHTIYQCVAPITQVGNLKDPRVENIATNIGLIPGDIALSGFEDYLSREWPNAMDSGDLYRPFRVLTAFWQIMQRGAESMNASLVLVDVGPNLGALNRSALIATDYVVAPLGADLFSLRGLSNLGPALTKWRGDWSNRLDNWKNPNFSLPKGEMKPIGYVVQQHIERLNRPVKAYDKWVRRIPEAYARGLAGRNDGAFPDAPNDDDSCLGTIKHYRSLVPMAQEVRKPVFALTNADGAIGSHAAAVRDARANFAALAWKICDRMESARSTADPIPGLAGSDLSEE